MLKCGHDLRPETVFWGSEQERNSERMKRHHLCRAPQGMESKLCQLAPDLSPTRGIVYMHRRGFVGVIVHLGSAEKCDIVEHMGCNIMAE